MAILTRNLAAMAEVAVANDVISIISISKRALRQRLDRQHHACFSSTRCICAIHWRRAWTLNPTACIRSKHFSHKVWKIWVKFFPANTRDSSLSLPPKTRLSHFDPRQITQTFTHSSPLFIIEREKTVKNCQSNWIWREKSTSVPIYHLTSALTSPPLALFSSLFDVLTRAWGWKGKCVLYSLLPNWIHSFSGWGNFVFY